jgi:hypothetical protein
VTVLVVVRIAMSLTIQRGTEGAAQSPPVLPRTLTDEALQVALQFAAIL